MNNLIPNKKELQIIEDNNLVDFQIARLAFKKGFNLPTEFYLCCQGLHYANPYNWNSLEYPYLHLSIPRKDELIKWLREMHVYHIACVCSTINNNKKW